MTAESSPIEGIFAKGISQRLLKMI